MRVDRTIKHARTSKQSEPYLQSADVPPVVLLVAPTGSRKSTLMRAAAVLFVAEHPGQSVVILTPRHKLNDEQIEKLREEHPDADFSAAVWRGRHQDDPEEPHPQHAGKLRQMCWRSDEAEDLDQALLDVERHMCKQGRGKKAIKCPFYDRCGYRRQKQIKANIWFAAHECMVHKKPKALGDVGWVMIDESPLDAFWFGIGIDIDDRTTLELDALKTSSPLRGLDPERSEAGQLMEARKALYRGLDTLKVPIERWLGVPASRRSLREFVNRREGKNISLAKYDASRMRSLELRGKVVPGIRPNMTEKTRNRQRRPATPLS